MSGVAELYTVESIDTQADFGIGVDRCAVHPRDVRRHEYIDNHRKLMIYLLAIVSADLRLMTFAACDIQPFEVVWRVPRLSYTELRAFCTGYTGSLGRQH